MLRAKRDDGFRLGLLTGDGTNQLLLLTWSMMLVSAENLFRIWPRGVTSKNLSREEIKIPHRHSESFFFLVWHLKVMLSSRLFSYVSQNFTSQLKKTIPIVQIMFLTRSKPCKGLDHTWVNCVNVVNLMLGSQCLSFI